MCQPLVIIFIDGSSFGTTYYGEAPRSFPRWSSSLPIHLAVKPKACCQSIELGEQKLKLLCGKVSVGICIDLLAGGIINGTSCLILDIL